ncbi:acyl-CoA dehydrogenase family protein [Roseateles koreensis]|uniref:Acyl-CoA/acyl-ACP dehydrogenase n=1 Tax=Roseateles koreensis TaxID=2987526 RepID=A0ABT5KLD9_9BURK|nr:acyl-CoA dehydrogenase family protein [Roseateles koreensis]MDC8783723.1 acyl-CoA/acyl-ACP dehydrogenase [Roseateles koreensis]
MGTSQQALAPNLAADLERICADIIAPHALETDRQARFPRAAVTALAQAGLLGLVSARELGGQGAGMAQASQMLQRIAQDCPSTAMVMCMHFCATALLEQQGPRATREAIAQGRHLSTLAFSEAGSRSHFWAPTGTARSEGAGVRLDANKSWVTSAGEADSYVWSSKPLSAEGASSLWLVDARATGLQVQGSFDGLGLRGNASSPVLAQGVPVTAEQLLGEDGKGFDAMMSTVLPWFSLLNASCSIGLMEGVLARACQHVGQTRHQHLDSSLADLPTVRAYLARARIRTDMCRCLLDDGLNAIAEGRADAMLRVLEIKAAAGESALEVSDLAMRVCGGAAFRKEAGIERLFRDARAAHVMAPTSDVLYDFIGKAITGLPLF